MSKLVLGTQAIIKPYQPSNTITAKLARRTVPFRNRRLIKFNLARAIVSFSFDDFPRSAMFNGSEVLDQENWKSTFYVSGGLMGANNHHGEQYVASDIPALVAKGHEIAGHTFNHIDCDQMGLQHTLADIETNNKALRNMGYHGPIDHFAYPFGATNAGLKHALQSKFKSMRGVVEGVHKTHADLNGLKSMPVFSGPKFANVLSEINNLKTNPAWLTLFAHDIRQNPSQWGCTPEEFKTIIAAVKNSGAIVLPVGEAIKVLEAQEKQNRMQYGVATQAPTNPSQEK